MEHLIEELKQIKAERVALDKKSNDLYHRQKEIEKEILKNPIYKELQPVTVTFDGGYSFPGFIERIRWFSDEKLEIVYEVFESDKTGKKPNFKATRTAHERNIQPRELAK